MYFAPFDEQPYLGLVPTADDYQTPQCEHVKARERAEDARQRRDSHTPTRSTVVHEREATEAVAAENAEARAKECEERARAQWDLAAQWHAATAARNGAAVAKNQRFWSMGEFLLLLLAFGAALYAATQAKRSADIAQTDLIARDRPQFNVRIENTNVFEALDSPAADKFPASVDFKPLNIGKRAAVVIASRGEIVLSNAPPIPSATAFKETVEFNQHIVIEERQDFPVIAVRILENGAEKTGVYEGETGLFAFGYIAYNDRVGGEWEAGFCYRLRAMGVLDGKTGVRKHTGGWFEPIGGPDYNFDRARPKQKRA